MNKKHTIKDIARLSGVSTGTVDRVLHNRGRVSEKAKLKVEEILKQINFQPNIIARSLKSNKIVNIAILLPDPEIDPYWLPCLKAISKIEEEYQSFNIAVTTYYFNPFDNKSFIDCNNKIMDSSHDAILFTPLFSEESKDVLNKYQTLNKVYGTFNTHIFSNEKPNFTGPDLYKSGRVAARLMELITTKGKIVILHIDEDYENAIHMQKKELGFKSYFASRQSCAHSILSVNLIQSEIETNIKNLIESNPDICGFFITTSKAYHVINAIPEDIINNRRIIGYDLLDENIKLLKQNKIDFLINQNPEKMAYTGLLQLIDFLLLNKNIPNVNYLPIEIINSENYNYYL